VVRAIPFAVVSALFIAAPVAAQPVPLADADSEQLVARLEDPATADAIADVTQSILRSVMAMPVGPIADAVRRMDPDADLADVPSDATVGELSGMDDDAIARVGDDTRAASRMAGTMSRQLVAMLPTLAAMARDLSAQWDAARRDAARR
jgi:hypothetical protein